MTDFERMAISLNSLGISMQEAVEAMQKLNQMLIDQLRPVSGEETETPNQKMDLEIFEEKAPSRIEPINNWYEELLNQVGHYDHLKII